MLWFGSIFCFVSYLLKYEIRYLQNHIRRQIESTHHKIIITHTHSQTDQSFLFAVLCRVMFLQEINKVTRNILEMKITKFLISTLFCHSEWFFFLLYLSIKPSNMQTSVMSS